MMTLIDNAVYVNGRRTENPATLDQTFEVLRERGGMGWIGLYRASDEEIRAVADEFNFHPLAVEDALSGHQRSKLERYGEMLFVVLRPARYIDETEEVEFGELHLFVGPDFVVTVRHAETPHLVKVRRRLEATPDLLARGPEAVLYAILDEVVDEYGPVIAGLQNDIDEIEDQLFDGEDDEDLSRRIYELAGEVIGFQRATQPLTGMLEALLRGSEMYKVDLELQRYLRDVLDHALRIAERAAAFRLLLDNALSVESTLIAHRQTDINLARNEEIKKISSWAAILFAPTLIVAVYGMNFDVLRELHWEFGYPFAIGLMVLTSIGLWTVFKYRKWI